MGVGERGRRRRRGLTLSAMAQARHGRAASLAGGTGQRPARVAKRGTESRKIESLTVLKLDTRIVEKPWGRRGVDPRFGLDGQAQVGEIWFEAPASRPLDVMAKYLFTTERL